MRLSAGEGSIHSVMSLAPSREGVVEHERVVEQGRPVAPLRHREHAGHVGGVLVIPENVQPEPAGLGLVKVVKDWSK